MLDLLLPSRCHACDAPWPGLICDACAPWTPHRVPSPSPLIRGVWALEPYGGPLSRAVVRAKRHHRRRLGLALGQELGAALLRSLGEQLPDAIVPIPSPLSRQLRRGFQPAALIAQGAGDVLGVPVCHALALHQGPRQSGLSRSQRARSLRGRVRSRQTVSGRVLLIDDVTTTGATAEACAVELLGGASDSVWLGVICAARDGSGDFATPRDSP